MANKYRGEVALPEAFGPGAFICFTLDDLVTVEEHYGLQFFDAIEQAMITQSIAEIVRILRVTLRRRAPDGSVEKCGEAFDLNVLHQNGFNFGDLAKPILDALAMSHVGKNYEDLVAEAEKARKAQLAKTIADAKEAAEKSDVPFEALLNVLLGQQTGQA
jgi:hypothetical protein